jgi:hypothetical protein
MKHLKTFENYISMAPEGMDQDLYFFLKDYLKDTKFEILYTIGFDDENIDDIHFVQEDGIDDYDKYVQIKDKTIPNESENAMTDYYASEFNVHSVENDINLDDEDESYIELSKILKSALDKYKKSVIYQTKKYNI